VANWVADFLDRHPDMAALPIAKRARHGLHFKRGRSVVAHFTGAPQHYFDAGEWKPLDTALIPIGTEYGAPGIPVRFRQSGGLYIPGGVYGQWTRRAGLYRPSTGNLLGTVNIPVGARDGDCLRASGAWWEHELRLTETGVRETLTLLERPAALDNAKAGDWLVLETLLSGVTLPDGWVDTWEADSLHFPPPEAHDAAGDVADCRRLARTVNGQQMLYTGVPVSWLQGATYPVVIDPDFAADRATYSYGEVSGQSADYATARSTLTHGNTTAMSVGQYWLAAPQNYFRVFRAACQFDTSTIGSGSAVIDATMTLTATTAMVLTANFLVQIVQSTCEAGQSNFISQDSYDAIRLAELDSIWRSTSGMATNTPYTSGPLDPTWVKKTGITQYGFRSHRDASATPPGTPSSSYEYIVLAVPNNLTPSYRPVLTVEYEAASGGAFGPRRTLLGVGR
jgi:hypothetical protein